MTSHTTRYVASVIATLSQPKYSSSARPRDTPGPPALVVLFQSPNVEVSGRATTPAAPAGGVLAKQSWHWDTCTASSRWVITLACLVGQLQCPLYNGHSELNPITRSHNFEWKTRSIAGSLGTCAFRYLSAPSSTILSAVHVVVDIPPNSGCALPDDFVHNFTFVRRVVAEVCISFFPDAIAPRTGSSPDACVLEGQIQGPSRSRQQRCNIRR